MLSRAFVPVGAALTLGGLLSSAALDHYSFSGTQARLEAPLSATFLLALFIGTPLTVVGSFVDRPITGKQARHRGFFCWLAAAVSILFFALFGNVHGWTFFFIFPAFAGFFAGTIYLYRSRLQRE